MLSQYSDDAYFEGSDGIHEGYSDYSEQEKSLRPTFSRFLSLLNHKQLTGGDLLEVGCGYGYLLDEAKPYFNQRVGTDFSLGAVKKASRYANDIFHGGIDEIPEGKIFDCIISVEVIEHIYDPKTFVKDLYHRLKPGGHLILATPDMGSFWRKGMQKRWPSFKLPEHVTYYDDYTLRKLYQDCGFEGVQKLPFPHAFPLSVFFEKLKLDFLPCPSMNIWFPHVVLGMSARRPYE
ncbi:MAG: class I SAM-dependent methyltransferase [Mariprofundaceae bacterium]|nr:class I SAM-dependent methyltransferase [Mariprofundaceae bacterium]